MDLEAFRDSSGRRLLHVDTWNVAAPSNQLVARDSFDLLSAAGGDSLRGLFRAFHPDTPASAVERARAVEPGNDLFRVFYLDYPGGDAKSWEEAYADPKTHALRAEYRERVAIYLHPFVTEVPGGFELVLQYWFFYPFNDGGNNHLGDWEHVNVMVQRRQDVTRPWDEAALRELLAAGTIETEGARALVIRRIDYCFHSNVMTLDFAAPNAYLPREEWKRERDAAMKHKVAREWIYDRIRSRAWQDDAETIPNTHPIAHIGADNKGTDQLLSGPGGTNRDSHGTYPFAGLFRDIGPAAAAEGINDYFDHAKYFALDAEERTARQTFGKGGVLTFGRERLRLMPDFEAVLGAMESDDEALRKWFWLVLPVRHGYPAVQSPMAGIVPHSETGNLAVVGGSFNGGWNAIGPSGGFNNYDPHALPGYFPTAWQDQFDNELGTLNLTYPTLSILPPFNLVWWGLAAPFRGILQEQEPKFFPSATIPSRFFGLASGYTSHEIDDDFLDLLYNDVQFRPLVIPWFTYLLNGGLDSTTTVTSQELISEPARSAWAQVDFFIGRRFVGENRLRHSRSVVGQDSRYSNIAGTASIRSELNMWEYAGSLRYNVAGDRFLPYVRAGYGLSWYRLENSSFNGVPLSEPNSPWIRKPSLSPLKNLLPNTLHVGAGAEWFVFRNRTPELPRGFDLALRADWALYMHDLGISFDTIPLVDLIDLGFAPADLPRGRTIYRNSLSLGACLSF